MGEPDAPRILVVEDEVDTAEMLARLLKRRFGASVDIALDADTAREKFSESAFDAVTLDYQMPECDGLTLLVEFLEKRKTVPVILVTGHGTDEVAERALKVGVAGYVLKDQRLPEMLTRAIERVLNPG